MASLSDAGARRAILVSFDGLSEDGIRNSLPATVISNFVELFETAACAEGAVPAFPSVTAASHSSIWTGAYGDVSGVTSNQQPRLPMDRHSLSEIVSGYFAVVQNAEPIWITAGRNGLRVTLVHGTQAPQAPGFYPERGDRDAHLEERRAAASEVLELPDVRVMNGYNLRFEAPLAISETEAPPRTARGWLNVGQLPSSPLPPLEVSWTVAGDSVFALLHGEAHYDRILVSQTRDVARGVTARAVPPDTTSPRDRPLARHFSEALELPTADGRMYLRVRLFHLDPDGSSFLVYQPSLHKFDANSPEFGEEYGMAVRGWSGNAAAVLFRSGAFGPSLGEGGDGTAEARYVESMEYHTRQYMRGVDWAWKTHHPDLLIDYFPLGDEVDHAFYGYYDTRWPGYTERGRANAAFVRERAWTLVDMRLEHLRGLVAADSSAALFVSGDHGMRATWASFRPNAALREAGLLALSEDGSVDLSRTRAFSPNGYWISVNRTARKGGVVPPEDESSVLEEVERALAAVRDGDGRPAVTAFYRPSEHPELGIGGPNGGDLYYGTGEGIRWSAEATGSPLAPAGIHAGHGFPSTDPDMLTVVCVEAPGLLQRRMERVRTIDVAPTVSDWLGIEHPADARGRSFLQELPLGMPTEKRSPTQRTP